MSVLSRYYVAFKCPRCGVGTREFSVNWLIGVDVLVGVIVGYCYGLYVMMK